MVIGKGVGPGQIEGLAQMPIYEMIETIILCLLSNGCTSGAFGAVTRAADGVFTVIVADRTFTARNTVIGWAVTVDHFTGEDADLLEAARLAVTA